MNPKPPRLAEWLLTRAVPGAFADSLAGDLAEEFARRQSSAWYWRQVAIALAARPRGHLAHGIPGRRRQRIPGLALRSPLPFHHAPHRRRGPAGVVGRLRVSVVK